VIYLDTSAFVKLVRLEPESAALRAYLGRSERPLLVSSALLAVEARRAVLREEPSLLGSTDLLLSRVGQLAVSRPVIESAGVLPGRLLRSLDAIHLATALLVREELEALVTYDQRLAEAAREQRLPVAAPAPQPSSPAGSSSRST
jgi:predicted nucleic acid-binding protein